MTPVRSPSSEAAGRTSQSREPLAPVQRLARLYDVQPSYADMAGRRVVASRESLLAVLRSLGAHVEIASDLRSAMHAREVELWSWQLEPVVVAWEGRLPRIALRLPRRDAHGAVECRLRLEDGEIRLSQDRLEELPVVARTVIDGEAYVALALPVRGRLPMGYHDLAIEAGGRSLAARIVSAPRQAYAPAGAKQWGVFLPLYATHSRRSRDIGDLTDLAGLVDWAARSGAGFVATLPLLASFLDEPFDPSPYAPVSRLFWNEIYIDASLPLTSADGRSRESRPTMQSPAPGASEGKLVDYKATMAAKRRVLESQAREVFSTAEGRRAFREFADANPRVEDYARFRAAVEKLGPDWRRWPEAARNGDLMPSDYDGDAARYYAFAQWRADAQMRSLAADARAKGAELYLDLPVGVHALGYDAWRYRELFVAGVAVGAPPDVVTTSGQDWGFQPLSPERLRRGGYAHVIDYLRHHLSVAGMLRVDHAMGLHRLYWIPDGAGTGDGVYVRYRPDDMYAILALESHRHQTVIVGENLGIVPRAVDRGLDRHGVAKMYVTCIELLKDPAHPLRPVPKSAVASFGTHDLPPFAAFWQGTDFEERVRLGVLDPEREQVERADREETKAALLQYLRGRGLLDEGEDAGSVYRGCLALLAESAAERVLINLEDTWLETEAQNVPGTTGDQYPSWRHRARYGLEEIAERPEVQRALDVVRRLRPAQQDSDD